MNFHEPEVVEMGLAGELIQEVENPVDLEGSISPTKTFAGVAVYSSPEVVEMGLAKELIQEVIDPMDLEGTISPTRTYAGIAIYRWE